MPRLSPRTHAGRVLLEDLKRNKSSWLGHGLAALAVTALGFGVAGAFAATSAAQVSDRPLPAQPAPATSTKTNASPSPSTTAPGAAAFERSTEGTSRDSGRAPLSRSEVSKLAEQRVKSLQASSTEVSEAERAQLAKSRTQELEKELAQTKETAKDLNAGDPAPAVEDPQQDVVTPSNDQAVLPVTNYTVAAKFGQIGPWARYHTGYDFAAPLGTPIHAPADGLVTHVGYGSAASWAGHYVTIKHADGTSTLYAHMATNTKVTVGESVRAGQVIGYVGLTGRTFGPHMHFEVYPVGVTPGDVYRATDPAVWLRARGLHP